MLSTTTDSAGHLQARLTGVRAGSKTIAANCQGVTLQAAASLVPGPPSALTSSLTSSASQAVADGHAQLQITLALADAQNNAIANDEVAPPRSHGLQFRPQEDILSYGLSDAMSRNREPGI